MNTPNSHGFSGQGNPQTFPSPFSGDASSASDSAGAAAGSGSSVRQQRGKNKSLKDLTGQHDHTDVATTSKPKFKRKPDPSTANITAPCSECGRRFWSQKALFGHMRCHPERQWRGINPPPHFHQPHLSLQSHHHHHPPPPQEARQFLDVELEVAAYLVMLANGPALADAPRLVSGAADIADAMTTTLPPPPPSAHLDCRFECSSCKKVFGSHQALGGHRASHKNVKGCFAMARNGGEDENNYCSHNSEFAGSSGGDGPNDGEKRAAEGIVLTNMGSGHRCNVCSKAFSSGQALGGHKRCHWERSGDEDGAGGPSGAIMGFALDLNLPPPAEKDASSSSSSSPEPILDLKLGI